MVVVGGRCPLLGLKADTEYRVAVGLDCATTRPSNFIIDVGRLNGNETIPLQPILAEIVTSLVGEALTHFDPAKYIQRKYI
jgi:hypothetical protein